MILLDGGPSILRSRGEPIVFRSPEETLEYARIHDIKRWMVYGDREGRWPIYTQEGPVNPPPPPKERVAVALNQPLDHVLGQQQPLATTAGAPLRQLLAHLFESHRCVGVGQEDAKN